MRDQVTPGDAVYIAIRATSDTLAPAADTIHWFLFDDGRQPPKSLDRVREKLEKNWEAQRQAVINARLAALHAATGSGKVPAIRQLSDVMIANFAQLYSDMADVLITRARFDEHDEATRWSKAKRLTAYADTHLPPAIIRTEAAVMHRAANAGDVPAMAVVIDTMLGNLQALFDRVVKLSTPDADASKAQDQTKKLAAEYGRRQAQLVTLVGAMHAATGSEKIAALEKALEAMPGDLQELFKQVAKQLTLVLEQTRAREEAQFRTPPRHYFYRGPWVRGTKYAVRDNVVNDRVDYICLRATSDTIPPAADTTHWFAMSDLGQSASPADPLKEVEVEYEQRQAQLAALAAAMHAATGPQKIPAMETAIDTMLQSFTDLLVQAWNLSEAGLNMSKEQANDLMAEVGVRQVLLLVQVGALDTMASGKIAAMEAVIDTMSGHTKELFARVSKLSVLDSSASKDQAKALEVEYDRRQTQLATLVGAMHTATDAGKTAAMETALDAIINDLGELRQRVLKLTTLTKVLPSR